jgi:hypothetical protein
MSGVKVGVVFVCAFAFACGGGATNTSADHPQGAANDAGPPASAGPTTTTTLLMGDAGELQGSKLTTTQNPVAIDGGASSGPPQGNGAGCNSSDRDPGRTQQDLITILRIHKPEGRVCYDTAVKSHPGIEGNIDISWRLDPKGVVVETGVDDSKSDIHDTGLAKCLGDVIRKIPWAPSPRGCESKVHYPFNFHPHGSQGNQP